MSTDTPTSEVVSHPLGVQNRSLELASERTAATRSAWFTPAPKRSLIPDLSPIGKVIVGSILLGLIFSTYLIALVPLYFYYRWVQQQNTPIPALRPELMAEELEEALKRAQNQAMVDCGVSETDWKDAVQSGRIVTVAESRNAIFVDGHGYRLAPEVRVVTAGAMDGGLVQHETTWLASLGPDPSNKGFVRSEDQQIPWRAVSRVRRSDGRLTIETVGGSSTTVSLMAAESRESNAAVNLNRADYITTYVPTFVEAAQKKVMSV